MSTAFWMHSTPSGNGNIRMYMQIYLYVSINVQGVVAKQKRGATQFSFLHLRIFRNSLWTNGRVISLIATKRRNS